MRKDSVKLIHSQQTVIWMTRHMKLDLLYRLRVVAAKMSVGPKRVPLWKAHIKVLEKGLKTVEKEYGIPRS